MDLGEDLCRSDYYDLICPKNEPGIPGQLTPVGYIDSDYGSSVTDSNNNLGAANHIKSFLDEMLFADNNGLTNTTSNGDLDGLAPNGSGSFELLSSFQWSGMSGATIGSNSDWLGGEVTTLTNLLDPLFVTYDGSDENPGSGQKQQIQYFAENGDGGNGESGPTNNPIVSSDLISTTYTLHTENSPSGSSSSDQQNNNTNNSDQQHQIWLKQENSPNSTFTFCDESLLRSALEAGKVIQVPNTLGFGKACDMTELRKVLSFPPLMSNNTSHSHSTSPSPTSSSSGTSTTPPGSSSSSPGTPLSNTSSSSNGNNNTDNVLPMTAIVTQQQSNNGVVTPYYEFKVLDPLYLTAVDEAHLPNVEELIMTRIHLDPPTSTASSAYNNRKSNGISDSERKINSTTTLSTKWTYATPNSQGKPVKRRKKKDANANAQQNQQQIASAAAAAASILTITSCSSNTDSSENSISNSNSDNSRSPNSNLSGTSRKERCLHYCNLCNKGFKDKYSVNVHVRTHTGEKPFGCSLCGKNFRQKAHLAKHYQTHAAKANGHTGKGKR